MRASVVIPAYNEAKTIASVLAAVKNSEPSIIGEVIVVSDGSTDETAEIARAAGVRVVELKENIGKGGAMMVGVEAANYEVILFLDADLIGLTPAHVSALLQPVISGEADMSVGIFEHGRIVTDLAQLVAPFLSGQRAIRSEVMYQIGNLSGLRFGVEVALNRYVDEHQLRVKEVVLEDLSHVMKEEKFGVVKGLAARMKMYWEIAKCVTRNTGWGS